MGAEMGLISGRPPVQCGSLPLSHFCHSNTHQTVMIPQCNVSTALKKVVLGPTLQELRILSSVTPYCQITMIVADTQNFYPILTSTRSLCTIIEVYCIM